MTRKLKIEKSLVFFSISIDAGMFNKTDKDYFAFHQKKRISEKVKETETKH